MDVVQGAVLKLDVSAKQALSAVTPWVGGEGEAAQSQVSNAGPLLVSTYFLITYLTFAVCVFPPLPISHAERRSFAFKLEIWSRS
jgi:hypothetical protein